MLKKKTRFVKECDVQLFLDAFDDEDPAGLQAISLPSAIQAFCAMATFCRGNGRCVPSVFSFFFKHFRHDQEIKGTGPTEK